jgi:four helix bundle protein
VFRIAGLRAAPRGARFARSLDISSARLGGRVRPRRVHGLHQGVVTMLRIYPVILDLVRFVRPLIKELKRHDPDLARQCKRAISSAPLNVAEGSYSRGKNRAARYHTALGSLREVLACFEVGAALGYVPDVEPELRARFDHVLGTLVRLAGGH